MRPIAMIVLVGAIGPATLIDLKNAAGVALKLKFRPAASTLGALIAVVSAGIAAAQVTSGPASPNGPPKDMKTFTKEAAPGEHAPGGPRDIAGVWTMRQFGRPAPYALKPAWRSKVAQPADPGRLDQATLLCVPVSPFEGGGYPVQIVQTPGQVTIIAEENHRYRRILLDRSPPKTPPTPTYMGQSFGRWEGDTLVVETVGLKRLFGVAPPPGLTVVERITKTADGRILQDSISYRSPTFLHDDDTVETYNWRPDVHLQESICEEFSDPFGAGYEK